MPEPLEIIESRSLFHIGMSNSDQTQEGYHVNVSESECRTRKAQRSKFWGGIMFLGIPQG